MAKSYKDSKKESQMSVVKEEDSAYCESTPKNFSKTEFKDS